MDIEVELAKLTPENRGKFERTLADVLYDHNWCISHDIDYSNPDILSAKELLYNEMFNQA